MGLTDENSRDWLRVAIGEVAHIHGDLLTEACAHTRKTCTHHGQIVPSIIKHTAERMEGRANIERLQRNAAEEAERRKWQRDLPKPDEWQPTADELEAIKRQAAANLKA